MVKLLTLTKDGKITIPKDIRKEIGLKGEGKYVLITDNEDIILKRISKDRSREKLVGLLKDFRFAFKKAKVTKKDVEEAIKAVRSK